MSGRLAFEGVMVGDVLPTISEPVRRIDLVRYCGVSGDFNVIHWNERIALSVGLPGVIAHGMLTMARAARVVTAWTADPGAVLEYGVRMTRPVPVPDDEQGTVLTISGVVRSLDEQAHTATVDLSATVDGATVLGRARAVVQLA